MLASAISGSRTAIFFGPLFLHVFLKYLNDSVIMPYHKSKSKESYGSGRAKRLKLLCFRITRLLQNSLVVDGNQTT